MCKNCLKVRVYKRGNVAGLGKHLAKKYGPADKGFFTRCMAAEELADYDEEARKGICAKAHKAQIGTWPGEGQSHKRKKMLVITKGGSGSGFHGHAGRPGQQGGSLPEGSVSSKPQDQFDNMVSHFNLEDGTYKLPVGKTIWVQTGMKPTDAYYGSSRISSPTYETVKTKKGDLFIKNPGGTWLLRAGSPDARRILFTAPSTASPFERDVSVKKVPAGLPKVERPKLVSFITR